MAKAAQKSRGIYRFGSRKVNYWEFSVIWNVRICVLNYLKGGFRPKYLIEMWIYKCHKQLQHVCSMLNPECWIPNAFPIVNLWLHFAFDIMSIPYWQWACECMWAASQVTESHLAANYFPLCSKTGATYTFRKSWVVGRGGVGQRGLRAGSYRLWNLPA